MQKSKSSYYNVLHWRDFRLQIFVEGIIIGLVSGLISVAFRWLIEEADVLRGKLYQTLKNGNVTHIALWFVVLVVIGFVLGRIVKWEPMSKGSGIPDVEGILAGHLKMNWAKVMIAKFVGGVLAIGSGLSLGREGPSVQLGAAVGQGFSRLMHRFKIEEKYLMTSGASAGLAAAFNAPLAGVIFALEELHKNFSPAVLMSAMAASLTADFVTQQAFGVKPIFSFQAMSIFPLKYYFYLIILGLICGAFGALFNKTLVRTLDLYEDQIWIPKAFVQAVPLLIAGVLGFVLPQALGGGNTLIEAITKNNFTFLMLFTLVVVKFLFTMASYGSGVPGGIFLPLLVIGALTGDIYGHTVISVLHLSNHYAINFVVLAMAAYFTAVVKAPVTGSVLITEMTGSFQHLLALITVSMMAYVMSDILQAKPIYEQLLTRSLARKGDVVSIGAHDKKVIAEVAVCMGSELDGKQIKNISWPDNSLLINIKRGESEIIPKGDTVLISGDYLYVVINESHAVTTNEKLLAMAEECYDR